MSAQTFNFTNESEFERTYIGKILLWVTSTGKKVIIMVNFLLICAFLSRFYFDRVLSDLNESIKIKQEIIKGNVQFEEEFRTLQKHLAQIGNLSANQEKSLAILKELFSAFSSGIRPSYLRFNPEDLSFSAKFFSYQQLRTFIQDLRNSKNIKTVVLKNVTKENIKNSQLEAEFNLQI